MEIWIIALLLMIIGILVASPGSSEFKINHMDKKLNKIMEHLGMEEVNIDKELKELIVDDGRIPAIKGLEKKQEWGLKKPKNMLII